MKENAGIVYSKINLKRNLESYSFVDSLSEEIKFEYDKNES